MNIACITTLNEAETTGPLVKALKARGFNVVVVDAGSEDRTRAVACKSGAYVFLARHCSIAEGLMAGWGFVCVKAGCVGGDIRVVQLDAGGSHNPDDALRLVGLLDDYDVVLGSRFLPGSIFAGPWTRRWRSRVVSIICNLFPGQKFSDWTSGYRAFRVLALERLLVNYKTGMHTWQIEVLQRARELGFSVTEVPISYRAGRSSAGRKVGRNLLTVWWGMFRA